MEETILIEASIKRLYLKMQGIEIQQMNISAYNKSYLKKYQDDFHFYMSLYAQLLVKSINKLKKPIAESTFIDYGGGSGMLSYLAKEVGFQTVVYVDLYQISVDDAKIISNHLGIEIDYFICGDVKEFTGKIKDLKIQADLICSFDVLEHIYDLTYWMKTIAEIENDFSLLFMTSANPKNILVSRRLKKIHRKCEYRGVEKGDNWKEMDLNSSFLIGRREIIRKRFPELTLEELNLLALRTRGLRKDGIEKLVSTYIETGKINYTIAHPTNTCDPYTGNWSEQLINLEELKLIARGEDLAVDITNSFYSYGDRKLLNVPKYILNKIIKLVGSNNLFFSPSYVLEIQKSL